MVVRDACPGCGSTSFKKNGHLHCGKQNHQCKACRRQFVASANGRIISDEQRTLIEHLLQECISLCGICRTVGVRLTWLLPFMVERFMACPEHLHVQQTASPTDVVIRHLEAEAEEMWSFVQKNYQGVIMATFDVTAYGAVGNGIADDTSSIRKAIDKAVTGGGGRVYFPQGTYPITAPLVLGKRLILQGDGPLVSSIHQ
jgi:polygalacturonase